MRTPAGAPAARRRCSRSATSRNCATAAARDELARLGHETTLSYLAEVAELVLERTGLLPHINAGVMSEEDLAMLRGVSISQGLMLESSAERLARRGGPHHGSPDKAPRARLETMTAAGRRCGSLHLGRPHRHRRDAAGAAGGAVRAARSPRRPRPHPGNHRPELPAQAGHPHGRRAGAVARRASVDDCAGAARLSRRR